MNYEYRAAWAYGYEARTNYGPARADHWACAEDIPGDAPWAWIEVRGVFPWEQSTMCRESPKVYGGWAS